MKLSSTAILLAAGQSKRFGRGNKLRKEINGKTLIQHAVLCILQSNINKLIVVVPPESESLKMDFDQQQLSKTLFVSNTNYQSGLASSIKAGVEHCEHSDLILIGLADMPHVKTDTVNVLLNAANNKIKQEEFVPEIFVPTYLAKQGNPVLFKSSMKPYLMDLSGDKGARVLIESLKHQNNKSVEFVSVDDPGIHHDYDLQSDFDT